MKAHHRHTLFWGVLSVFFALILVAIIVPPMFNLKHLRPGFEQVLKSQTGIDAKINGKINISLLRRAHVVAHDVVISNGKIDSVMFTIPLLKIFDVNNAEFAGKIYIDGARLSAQDLSTPKLTSTIEISNSRIGFMGKSYKITDATLKDGNFNGWVRSNQHKYLIETKDSRFIVSNKNEGLFINGILLENGGARANLIIDTDDINSWFEFFEPKIYEHVSLTMNIDWDGKYGFNFSDINGAIGKDKFMGSIILPSDGSNAKINFSSDDINFDLSFLLSNKSLLKNTDLDLDLHGNLKFADTNYSRVKLNASGSDDKIKIKNLEFENNEIVGTIVGDILGTGAKDLNIRFRKDNALVYCLFSGTPQIWRCDEYEYTDKNIAATGTIISDNGSFKTTLLSKNTMPENIDFAAESYFMGTNGTIIFKFENMGGEIKIANKQQTIKYDFVNGKNLKWLGDNSFEFLPESMRAQTGKMIWKDQDFSFTPENKKWELTSQKNFFYLSGNSILGFINAFNQEIQLPFVRDFPYELSGNYSNNYISDLELRIANHIFRGSINGADITLNTETLDLDKLANKQYFDNYEEMQFLSAAPILAPFKIGNIGISLSANNIIWRGEEYDNFIYSLHDSAQDFSITDDARGSFLASIKTIGNGYGILVKLNRFAFIGKLLDLDFPLNISDSVVTGQAQLTTNGKIAYDFWRNMKGLIELSFDGGIIDGIGTDAFYAHAPEITSTTAEDAIANAISGGKTKIKTLQINGEYENGKFKTTELSMTARHTEISGDLELNDGKMSADLQILLHGAAVQTKPISLKILPTGERRYSLSEIMRMLDIGYMNEFIRTHNQF